MRSLHTGLSLHRTIVAAFGLLLSCTVTAESVPIQTLTTPPALDGNGDDWAGVSGTRVKLHKSKPGATTQTQSVLIKGGIYGDSVFFYLEWEDRTEDVLHKPWVWDAAKKKYVKGPQREDRLAIQFATGGDYTTDWLSGREFTADMWHWKASRSNPVGLAHDKSTRISRHKLVRSRKITTDDAGPLYIVRPSDSGDKLYSVKRYHAYREAVMPKYLVNDSPRGSVADVKARGVWADGMWRLELRRKLDTGNSDDVVFVPGQALIGGLAIFDKSENDDHAVSDNLTFQY